METKKCTNCKKILPVDEFYFNKKIQRVWCYCNNCAKELRAAYQKANRKRLNENAKRYHKERVAKDPAYKLTMWTRSIVCNSFKRKLDNNFTKRKKTEDILGCTLEFFVSYIESKLTKGMTLDNYGEWHLDHIIPLATAETEEDIERLNHYTNYQPLWAEDNYQKRDKIL